MRQDKEIGANMQGNGFCGHMCAESEGLRYKQESESAYAVCVIFRNAAHKS